MVLRQLFDLARRFSECGLKIWFQETCFSNSEKLELVLTSLGQLQRNWQPDNRQVTNPEWRLHYTHSGDKMSPQRWQNLKSFFGSHEDNHTI